MPGSYRLLATAPGYAPGAIEVRLVAGREMEVRIELGRGGTIHGPVTLGGAPVDAFVADVTDTQPDDLGDPEHTPISKALEWAVGHEEFQFSGTSSGTNRVQQPAAPRR